MVSAQIVLIIYGLFLILGGAMGFKKGSTVSLVAGLVSGILVLAGAWALGPWPHNAWVFLTVVAALLTLSFISRLMKTRKFMPSGMLLAVTVAVLVFCIVHLHA